MNWFPFSRFGIELTLNIATIWLLLEAFDWRPWRQPPWRSNHMHFWMTVLLSLAVVLFATNLFLVLVTMTGGH